MIAQEQYNLWSLIATIIYDFLTLGLLSFAFYEVMIKPRFPNIALFIQDLPSDTQTWGYEAQIVDFVLENRGVEIKNVRIKSMPDELGWDRITKDAPLKKTSDYFKKAIPYIEKGQKMKFLWCEMKANIEIVKKPFEILIEYDNPVPIYNLVKKRRQERIPFDFSFFDGILHGVTERYDIHNVAKELFRIREILEKMKKAGK